MADGASFTLSLSRAARAFLGSERQAPVDFEPEAYRPAPAIPKFSVTLIRQGEPAQTAPSPAIASAPGLFDLSAHDGPSCLFHLPRTGGPKRVTAFAQCELCGRAVTVPMDGKPPGSVRIDCRKKAGAPMKAAGFSVSDRRGF